MKQAKIWGITEKLMSMNNVEIHRIDIIKNGYCSKHKHDFKFNMFYIEKGKLQVDVWENDVDQMNSTIISDNQSTIIEPKMFHKFTALEPTIAYEIYWVKLFDDDIVREDFGGVK